MKELLLIPNFEFKILYQKQLSDNHPLFALQRDNVRFRALNVPTVGPKRDMEMYMVRKEINSYDIYHCLSSYMPAYGLHIPSVVTIHDLKYMLFPELLSNAFKRPYYKWIISRSMRRATYIISVSISTKKDIVKRGISPQKIFVIYEAPTIKTHSEMTLPDFLQDKPFLLYVGENRPHKNISNIIRAYKLVENHMKRDCPFMVFVGQKFDLYKRNNQNTKILFLGSILDTLLVTLYKKTLALIYPSFYEGFGLPILEAMALGTPVITSNCSSMPEVAGGAAILIDPHNVNQLADAILKIIQHKSERDRISALGIQRAKTFTWRKTAYQVSALYSKIPF